MEKKYFYPSNGTEGDSFCAKFCEVCYRGKKCSILFNSIIGNKPTQWYYDDENVPCCSEFRRYAKPFFRHNKFKMKGPNLFDFDYSD